MTTSKRRLRLGAKSFFLCLALSRGAWGIEAYVTNSTSTPVNVQISSAQGAVPVNCVSGCSGSSSGGGTWTANGVVVSSGVPAQFMNPSGNTQMGEVDVSSRQIVSVPLAVELASGTPANPWTVSVPLALQLSSGTAANPWTVTIPLSVQLASGTPANPFYVTIPLAIQLASGTAANPWIVSVPLSLQLSSGTPANPFFVQVPLALQLASNTINVNGAGFFTVLQGSGSATFSWRVDLSTAGTTANPFAVQGTAAAGSAASGNPLQAGLVVSSSAFATLQNQGTMQPVAGDEFGRPLFMGGANPSQVFKSSAILQGSVGPIVVISSAGAATFADICYCNISNTSQNSVYAVFQSTGSQANAGAGGVASQTPQAFTVMLSSNSDVPISMGMGCGSPIPQSSSGANKNWTVAVSAAVNAVIVDCWYMKEPR